MVEVHYITLNLKKNVKEGVKPKLVYREKKCG